jgi:hypothetical protein
MEIKRGFVNLPVGRKFEVVINDRDAGILKGFGKIEVEQPESEFTIYFTTMKFERSKKCRISTDEKIRIVAKINPLYIIFNLAMGVGFFLFIAFRNQIDYSFLYLMSFVVSTLAIYYLFIVKRYITFKAYDMNNKRIPIKSISFSD